MSKKKRLVTSITAIASLSMLITACSGGKTVEPAGSPANSTAVVDTTPLQLTVMTQSTAPTPPSPDSEVQKQIEKAVNAKLNIQWVATGNYTDKLNVTLASGAIPDLIFINDPFTPVFRQMVGQGAFWDISSIIKDYPNLSGKISQTAWDLTKQQDGKNYGVPRPRPLEAEGFVVMRKDWLDKYGLKVPTTTDELYQALKTFKEKGNKDTVPFTGYVTAQDMGTFAQLENSFTGVNSLWKQVNGNLTFTALLPEQRQAIEYLKKLYDEKLIPEDFASIKQTAANDIFKANRSGALVEKVGGGGPAYMDPIRKLDPNAKDIDFYPLTNLNGYNPKGTGFSGIMAIPKSVPEAKMKRILKMMDTWMNDDVFVIQQYGIEGVHHTIVDGKKVVDSQKATQDGIGDYNQIVYVADPYASSVKIAQTQEINDLYRKIQDERAKTSSADVTTGLYSPTADLHMPDIKKKMTDLKLKIILGTEPISAWDDYVNKLKADSNLTKIAQELNDALKARQAAAK